MRILALLLLILAAVIVYHTRPDTTGNRLAIGKEAKVDKLDIALNPPGEFDNLSREAVLAQRRAMVRRYPDLFADDYQPLPAVFGQIEDGRPWWGIEGQFYHGDGQRSIEGPSEESRFILNPYLLVAAEFYRGWKDDITEEEMTRFPLVCLPQQLVWKPRAAYAEVSYDADCVRKRLNSNFGLIAYNARDLGFSHIYLSYTDSENVTESDYWTAVQALPQFIHSGGSCGYPGGCNNMSPATPNLWLLGLPAKVVVWLWRDQPRSPYQPPDMRYVIHFR